MFGGSELRAELCGKSIQGSVPSQPEEGGLQSGHVLAARTVLITWDSGHILSRVLSPHTHPAKPLWPIFPFLLPILSQISRPELCWPVWGSTGKEGGWRSDAVRG